MRRKKRQMPWYPSRLLHIDHDSQRAHILETSQTQCEGSYLTINYRWQNIPSFLLTNSTYSAMTNAFSVSDLPHVFRDAINVCGRLGIDTLWIDALCIKQDADDQSDWQRESLQMHQIYSNAFLNISATSARDGGCSSFADRDPTILPEPIVSVTIDGLHKWCRVRNMCFWQGEVLITPLNLRGWAFQERLLAQRLLRFGRNQITWECAESIAAESYPDGVPLVLMAPGISAKFIQHLPLLDQETSSDNRAELYRQWDKVIDAYSQCSLTKREDKLVALAGIAKIFARFLKTQYVAGMWRKDLSQALLWELNYYKHDLERPSRRASKYRAPSWSWASVDGTISTSHFEATMSRWEVLDVRLDLASEDEMSPMEDASLLLKCEMCRVTVTAEREMAPWGEERVFSFTGDGGETKKITLCTDWDESEDSANMADVEAYFASAGYWEQEGSLRGHGFYCDLLIPQSSQALTVVAHTSRLVLGTFARKGFA